MTTYSTQNPLGSSDPRDLYDNAENLDDAVNSSADTFKDRLGKSRLTWAGIVKAGSGDPATAVDAANRAVGAAGQAENSADRAAGAADRAEVAAVSALAAGNLFNTTTQGLAATVDGQYFLLNTVDPQVFDVYLNDEGVAVGQPDHIKISDGSEAFDVVKARRLSLQLPNVLSQGEVSSTLPPIVLTATTERVELGGAFATRISGTTSTARCYWSVDASNFPSGFVSAYVVISDRSAGNGGYVRILQRDASGSLIKEDRLQEGMGPASSKAEEVHGFTTLNQEAVTVDLDIVMNGENRVFTVQSPMLADGVFSGFRLPEDKTPAFFRSITSINGQTAGVEPFYLQMPLADTPALLPEGTLRLTPEVSDSNKASTVSATFSSISPSDVAAFKIGSGLGSGEVVRIEVTPQSTDINPALGLLFGDGSELSGFGLRSSAQLLTLNWPSNTGSATGPAARPYSNGSRISIDARLLSGSPGDYTVRYFVEYSDGERFGPYDVDGITSIDEVWFGARSASKWEDIVVTRHSAPQYLDEWVDNQTSPSSANIVYVATTGDDNNQGTIGSPFRTISKGVASLPHGGVVEVAGGEYRESVTSSTPKSIWIRSKKGERAYILGSTQLTLTKTAGYNQIYQAPLDSKPVGMGGGRGEPVIFEWGTPSKPIPDEERHPLHRGKSYRLPYTEMFEAASLEDLDTSTGMWWWESGVIYLSATDGSDASLKRYEARERQCLVQSAGGIRLSRIHIMFSSSVGANFNGDVAVTEDVVVLGSYHNGFYHQSGVWKSYRDEAGGNGNDGFNGTVSDFTGTDDSGNRITAFFYDPYGHDNSDDGTSYHYRGDATYHGGLFEYNTKADVVHVTGAAVTCFDTVARGSQNGFYSSTEPTSDASREFSSLRCVGTKAINNRYSYRVTNGCFMECDNVVAINPSFFGYIQEGDGVLVARNSKYTGDPAKMKDGNVEVINDGALT